MRKVIKLIKNNILGFIIGVLMTSSVGVIAATLYYSNQVSYTPSDTSWNVDNVEKALNELRSSSVNNKSTEIYYLGTGTEFDLKTLTDLDDTTLDNLSDVNFIVGIQTSKSTTASIVYGQPGGYSWYANAGGFSLTKSYDVETHILKLQGVKQSIKLYSQESGSTKGTWSSTQNLTGFAYLVIGEIK